MSKINILSVFLICLAFLLPRILHSKVVTEKFDLDSESEFNQLLVNNKNKKKVDVEMLGLDDVETEGGKSKKTGLASKEVLLPVIKMPTAIKKKEPEKKKTKNPPVKNIRSGSKDAQNLNKELSKSNSNIFGKIKSFIDKKTDHENKKITIKLLSNKNKVKKGKKVKKNTLKERRKKMAKEKRARLNKLRSEYLIKISKDRSSQIDKEEIIVPRKKKLSWGDSFYKTVDMAPPLLSRSRSDDNSHIPIIPTFKEKVLGLFGTIKSKDINAFNDFYSKITIPDLRNQKGDTILTYALLLKRHQVISSILSKGADPDLTNALGHAPLDIAIENLDLKSVKILIDNHVDIDYSDRYGRTYLMLAARRGYLPIVQLLVENGANVNGVDSSGTTALNIAYRHKKEIVAKYLLKSGAKTWVEKPYATGNQQLIKELENRWKRPIFNSQ